METTIDSLLGSRFAVEQPSEGYRIAVDTLLLASAVPVQFGQQALDMGCGVGGVMLAVAARVSGISITGLEIQPFMVELCDSNIRRNVFEDRLRVVQGDVAKLDEGLIGCFDHVMSNPPYHDGKKHSTSAVESKRLANTESEDADLSIWVAQAARFLKDDGMLTMIHRADRLKEIFAHAQSHFSSIIVKPIIARVGAMPKRVILRCMKEGEAGVRILTPFVLYGADNRYCPAAEALLREAQEMPFE